jgi:hypothetical protein
LPPNQADDRHSSNFWLVGQEVCHQSFQSISKQVKIKWKTK